MDASDTGSEDFSIQKSTKRHVIPAFDPLNSSSFCRSRKDPQISLSVISAVFRRYFVMAVLLASLAGYLLPGIVRWVGWSSTVPVLGSVNGVLVGLGIIMFGMGMTLSVDEFVRALTHPARIVLGVLLQYALMPGLALFLVVVTGLPRSLGLGVILLGCCPGGTASNVMAFLAEADVPLSIAVTLLSTFLAPIATPWLFWLFGGQFYGVYLGETITVPVLLLTRAIIIVVVPILLGLLIKAVGNVSAFEETIEQIFSLLSILVICLIVAYVVSTAGLVSLSGRASVAVMIAVFFHNFLGLTTGYFAAAGFGLPVLSVQSLSLEVGMQNSGLAMALAGLLESRLIELSQFSSEELTLLAVPAVLFSVWHNLSGPFLASRWSHQSNGGSGPEA